MPENKEEQFGPQQKPLEPEQEPQGSEAKTVPDKITSQHRKTQIATPEAMQVELENSEEVEMPESFIEPKGKSGKWSVVVENKELGVSYREKIIEFLELRNATNPPKMVK